MNTSKVKPGWIFWLIGILALIWNAMGCMNYLMQSNPEALADYPEAARSLELISKLIWHADPALCCNLRSSFT